MEATLTFNAEDIARLGMVAMLRQIRDRARDFRPLWPTALDIMFEHEAKLFSTEGASGDEGKWAPLTKRYAEIKGLLFPGRKLLNLTGKLVRQLSGLSGDHFEKRTKSRLIMGSNYPIKWKGGRDDLGGLMMSGRAGDALMPVEGPRGPAFAVRGWRDWVAPGDRRVPPMVERPPISISDSLVDELADVTLNYLLLGVH